MKILRIPLVIVLIIVAGRAFNADAQTETILHTFGSGTTNGAAPLAGLVQGSDGNFYGTTSSGGTGSTYGTVFRISPSGSYTNLYSFGSSLTNGYDSRAGLVQGSDGNFYGTAYYGGTNSCNCGTVFRIYPSGTYTNLYSFAGSPNDGGNPSAGLVQGIDGNFYGTASEGGIGFPYGTVFRISPGGSYTNLYSFRGPPNDGNSPLAGLVQGSDSNFYGTTYSGGKSGLGTVFRMNPSGSYTNLYSFAGSPNDGANPDAGLVPGSDGNFYGTTSYGGTNGVEYGGDGTVFRISPSGTYTSLYSFGSSPTDGEIPDAGLVLGSDGNFYGTTSAGGTNDVEYGGDGTVFRISPGGSHTNLYSFGSSSADGEDPEAGVVQGSDGNFYGTTFYGGAGGVGIVFKLTVPLNPAANQISGIQLSGTNIIFTIPSVATETYQLQFSSSMTPTNWVNVPGVSVTNSIGALLTLTNFGGVVGPQGFFRFDITP